MGAGLNESVSAERVHICFFGLCNAGKSSVVNCVTGQKMSLVSEVAGTTTDPVQKSMELLPVGPVVIIDTPGIDDDGELGEMRVRRAKQVLNKTDVAVLVVNICKGMQETDRQLIDMFKMRQVPYLIVYNKIDLLEKWEDIEKTSGEPCIFVSAKDNQNIEELKNQIAHLAKGKENQKRIVADLIKPGDFVVLVIPIDEAAPKGRLILPQQQTIREILDIGASAIVTRETELAETLKNFHKKPALVITDSQVFEMVHEIVPEDIPLTSFSILFARYKGNFACAVEGAQMLRKLRDGDKVLISEGCTHHRQCGDIGTVKLPFWIKNYTGKKLEFEFTSGIEFPEDLSPYALIIHCGGCMLNEREMKERFRHAKDCQTAITNYGMAIAQMHGILERSLKLFINIRENE